MKIFSTLKILTNSRLTICSVTSFFHFAGVCQVCKTYNATKKIVLAHLFIFLKKFDDFSQKNLLKE